MGLLKGNKILLAHGDGGMLSHELTGSLFLKYFSDPILGLLGDAAVVSIPGGRIAFSTDSFVVNPVFFPGGDIGKLAVCGTVNDLAVSGAVPQYLSVSFILEEGLAMDDLERIVASMAATARSASVKIIAGDTKVVERGNADKIYITTSGLGFVSPRVRLGYDLIRPGDVLIINGGIGEHGMAVLSKRDGIAFESPVQSDCAPLNHLIGELLGQFKTIRLMRDPTRGGLATTAKEMARSTGTDLLLFEEKIPVSSVVATGAEMLGLDPLYLANEGKVVIIASSREAEDIVACLRSHPLGVGSGVIGEVREGKGDVYLKTVLGGTRFLDLLIGSELPRIC